MPNLDKKTRSREERASFLRNQWSGQNQSLNSSPRPQYENLLQGVLFNALPRATAGKDISGLEARLIAFANELADDEAELAEYGQLFHESKRAYGTNMQTLYPAALLNLAADEPFTIKHLVDYAVDHHDEFAELPENKIVDLAQVQGSYAESEEHKNVVSGTGRGSIVFDSSTPATRAGYASHCDLVARRFDVYEAPGDAMNSKAELYFTWACGADNNAQKSIKTRTFGSIRDGDVREFTGDNVLFAGEMEFCLFGHITAWEEDDSTSGWVNALVKYCGDVATQMADGAMETARHPSRESKRAAMMLFLGSAIAWGMAAIVQAWRNLDDKCGELMLGFTKAGLADFLSNPDREVELFIPCASGMGIISIILKASLWGTDLGTTMIQVKSGEKWSPPAQVTPGGQESKSFEGMAMVDRSDGLVGLYNNWENAWSRWVELRPSNSAWLTPVDAHAGGRSKIAVCWWRDNLLRAYRDAYNEIRLDYSKGDLSTWTSHRQGDNRVQGFRGGVGSSVLHWYWEMAHGPAMATIDVNNSTAMAIAITSNGGVMYHVDHHNVRYTDRAMVASSYTALAPSLVTFDGHMYLFFVSAYSATADEIHYSRMYDTHDYFGPVVSLQLYSSASVGACVHEGKLWLAYRSREKENHTVKTAVLFKDSLANLHVEISDQDVPGSQAYSTPQIYSSKALGNKLFLSYGNPG